MRADSTRHAQISGAAEASLEKDSKGLFLKAASHSFQLAEFAAKGKARTVLVEGEIFQRLQVTDDLGAKGDETGRVKLTIRPIESSGEFGAILATREVPGDDVKLDARLFDEARMERRLRDARKSYCDRFGLTPISIPFVSE